MPTEVPRTLLELRYHREAQEYLRNLPPEHFMEATPQATQREITLASFAVVRALWTAFHFFNELLVQYSRRGERKPGQVVPDNMVVVHEGKIEAEGSYDVELQPAAPFWVLEYVSRTNQRKDYEDNLVKYERELKVPYFLLFRPDIQELILYRHNRRKYVTVKPNGNDRYAIPELEMEIAILDGWVRFWFRGELLPLPADLLRQVQEANRRLTEERLARLAAEAEVARLRTELEALRGERPGKK